MNETKVSYSFSCSFIWLSVEFNSNRLSAPFYWLTPQLSVLFCSRIFLFHFGLFIGVITFHLTSLNFNLIWMIYSIKVDHIDPIRLNYNFDGDMIRQTNMSGWRWTLCVRTCYVPVRTINQQPGWFPLRVSGFWPQKEFVTSSGEYTSSN